ncbi:MAG: PEP-CTERM sorting domain-containing protein [Planctomycetaceae bacterium]|nr:MAG: PEP-CTERM sorting domain-containing protein [Planctomycetaceae bacterium]
MHPLHKLPFVFLFALALQLADSTPAKSELVLLGFGDVQWDVSTTPSPSPLLSLRLDTDGNPGFNALNGMNFGILVTPRAGATGTISLADVTAPGSGGVFANYFIDSFPITPEIIVTDVYDPVNPANVTVSSLTNLVDIRFTTNGADGLFDIYAVAEFTRYFYLPGDPFESGEAYFANIPDTPLGNQFLLGTLDVTNMAAVPEPGTVAMVSMVVAIGCASRRRRKSASRLNRPIETETDLHPSCTDA